MGCSCTKPRRMIFGGQIDGIQMEESSRFITEIRSIGPSDSSALALGGSTSPRKLKDVISNNPDSFTFVNDFLNHVVIMPSRSLTAPKHGIEKVRAGLGTVRDALLRFEEESDVKKSMELRAVAELPAVPRLNTKELRSACEHQLVLLEKLSRRKHKLEKSLGWTRKWRKAWNVIYGMFFIGVMACSVVLIALAAPPAASTATTMTSSGMQSMKTWFDSLWDGREGILEAEMEVVAAMERSRILVHEFAKVRSLLEVVNVDAGAMLEGIDFVLHRKEEEAVVAVLKTFGTGYIKNKIGAVEKRIDELDEELYRCMSEVRKAAAEFLEVVTEEIK